MTNKGPAALLKFFRTLPFRDELMALTVPTLTQDDVTHLAGATPCSARNDRFLSVRSRFQWQTVSLPSTSRTSLPDVLGPTFCTTCAEHATALSYDNVSNTFYNHGVYRAALALDTVETALTSAGKITKSTTASAIQTRINKLSSLDYYLNQARTSGSGSTALLEHLDDVTKRLLGVKEKLTAAAKGDNARALLEAKVQEMMVPKRFRGQFLNLDHRPALIGLSPTPNHAGPQVMAVLDAYAVRRDAVTVLHAPAYMHAFLLQQLYSKPTARTLVVSVEAPESPEVRETAAALWDPEGESTLACISLSVQAAGALAD